MVEQVPRLPETRDSSSSPNLKKHVKGPVPPVYVAVKVATWLGLGLVGETVKLLITSGGMENVKVAGWPGRIGIVLRGCKSTVLPWTMVTLRTRPK